MSCSIKYLEIWKFTQYIIHIINIRKVLKKGPKIKSIPSFERGDHVDFRYIIKNEF